MRRTGCKRKMVELNGDLHKGLKIDAINRGKTMAHILGRIVKKYLDSKKASR